MSQLTLQLLRSAVTARRSVWWQATFHNVTDRLLAAYGRPSLGNFRDPVREILYIVLSARTTERLYQRAHRRLIRQFPCIRGLACASVSDIAECVKGAGLANKRARQVKAIAERLVADFGENPSRALRKLEPQAAFSYLVSLPGVGPKSAFCIMAMSLDADVFAVDVNVHRIAERLGALRPRLKHYQAQQRLPALVPSGRARELHVGMVVHGREICLPRNPTCERCVLLDLCRYGLHRMNGPRTMSEHDAA